MEAPEYLDLDEIDFSDDISYSVTSLKTIPELCRRCDSQSEDRSVSSSSWNCSVSALITNTQKPTGIADVYGKFRPVKRVSPLKHQPETLENNESDDQKNQKVEYQKGSDSDPGPQPEELSPGDGDGGPQSKSTEPSTLLGELEHYDLDMDEILDVPYIKSSQQLASFTKVTPEKRILGLCTTINGLSGKACSPGSAENSPAAMTPFCVLSPVKSPHLRKASSVVREQQKLSAEESESSPPLVKCGSAYEPENQTKDFLNKTFNEPPGRKREKAMPDCQLRAFHPQSSATDPKLEEQVGGVTWTSPQGPEERSEYLKKVKSILNIVKEGQISLLPHLAADNLDKIHDENGNNLLHVAASQGHAECLQHLTSLMGEDCLSERNAEKLTPAGLAIKNGQLECVRWMVSETEAIAELSCSKDFPSLIHYAGCFGQEKILLWLLQFMQEQGISLDEVDQDGNSAVHVASQHGYLGCIQTLVEYGANVTMQNHAGEKPSQSAERHGHTLCSRYLVVVETCMSLASQVVKLTKQLKEQTMERVTLQNQLQQLLEAQKSESLVSSPSSPSSPASRRSQWKSPDADDESVAKSKPGVQEGIQVLGSLSASGRARAKAKDEDSDKILRQLLGKDISESVCTQEKLSLEFQDAQASSRNGKKIPAEKRELKLARLRQLMQRSLSESDTDSNTSEDPKSTPVRKPDRPRPQPIVGSVESVDSAESLHLMIKKHTLASGRRFPFGIKASKSLDGHSPSPTSESSEPDLESQCPSSGTTPPSQPSGDPIQPSPDSTTAQKVAMSPKSALKSPSSKRRTSQNLKLRVTFEEPVVQMEQTNLEVNGEKDRDKGRTLQKASANSESGDQLKRPFGTFRSIMETLSGNQNNNNNSQAANQLKMSTLPLASLGRKTTDAKGNPVSSASKGKNKAEMYGSCVTLSSNTLTGEPLRNHAWHNDINRKMKKSYSIKHNAEPESKELFL
ncbi:synphilin-1 isoform X1 [Ailuropoda melanoleuca]|uniref:Synphilin-1 n=1 Tax=Ailuropoda melanoleuca TaxID=9646 RepID=G1MBD4_AILME|nr:synphilin-1 isoform X1 [Ailuropoda melanoleuca]XP_034511806.1 synphilin-1 isoform X1 [Ailuropoda melanoleuca]XP_034511807.1 synphilin-1 isoform X1 [Ailuropoda melanoleuca]XP_034511808.1 synphilin-1 isoform X1 [Ailuropoda melanoleuca]